jgi:putative endonuclease
MTNTSETIYVGSTIDLLSRVQDHLEGRLATFTKTYHCHRLVYYETPPSLTDARFREYQIKRWRREKKIRLITSKNPAWIDLSIELFQKGLSDEDAS